ncbi:MAG: anthranilate synthase component I [Rhizobiales bacterium 32-66-8]|nr:MAG: anthranilate synthase component I [Rhizobiales bacterium 32-66-8]
MNASFDFDAFALRYGQGEAQVLSTTLVADLETPVSAFLKIAGDRPNAFLLESVEGGQTRGRYSMIGLEPDVIWRANGDKAEINRSALTDASAFTPCTEPPLAALRALLAESAIPLPQGSPPMAAGVFGYLGYDMVRQMEHLGAAKPDPIGVPEALLIRPTVMVVFDAVKDELTAVTPIRPQANISVEPVSNTTEAQFCAMVDKAKDYIRAGDIFQVVLSQRFESPFTLPPFALYRALRRVNPAPFLVYLNFDGFSVVCSSPEILVRLRDGKVTIRPIAGTRRRGATPGEDDALANELLADPKERAEHLMLLDLGRNDVGRVSEIGSVEVTDSFFIERYSQVMHIVSNVEGRVNPQFDALDALAAGFPAGTVSGAPKVRAMQIIDELESEKRGIYAGAIGYFGANGEMDTCIVLRTAVVKDGRMFVQAGAGLVYDSVPSSEHQECVNKAKALFRAGEEAVRFAARAGRGQ